MTEPFSLSAFLPYRLAVLSERVSRRLTVEYERTHGLNVAEWRVLVHIQRWGEASVRDIHNDANLDKPRVSRAVARLETSGLVRKSVDAGDGRLISIALTAKGQTVLAEIIPAVTEIEAGLLDGLTPEEMKVFYGVMEKIHRTLDQDPEAKPRAQKDESAC